MMFFQLHVTLASMNFIFLSKLSLSIDFYFVVTIVSNDPNVRPFMIFHEMFLWVIDGNPTTSSTVVFPLLSCEYCSRSN